MTVEQALAFVQRENLKDVLILGFAEDGEFVARSSNMSRKDALWLIEHGRRHTMGG